MNLLCILLGHSMRLVDSDIDGESVCDRCGHKGDYIRWPHPKLEAGAGPVFKGYDPAEPGGDKETRGIYSIDDDELTITLADICNMTDDDNIRKMASHCLDLVAQKVIDKKVENHNHHALMFNAALSNVIQMKLSTIDQGALNENSIVIIKSKDQIAPDSLKALMRKLPPGVLYWFMRPGESIETMDEYAMNEAGWVRACDHTSKCKF